MWVGVWIWLVGFVGAMGSFLGFTGTGTNVAAVFEAWLGSVELAEVGLSLSLFRFRQHVRGWVGLGS